MFCGTKTAVMGLSSVFRPSVDRSLKRSKYPSDVNGSGSARGWLFELDQCGLAGVPAPAPLANGVSKRSGCVLESCMVSGSNSMTPSLLDDVERAPRYTMPFCRSNRAVEALP